MSTMIQENSAPENYARLLLSRANGYPLWVPGPNTRSPGSYQKHGISVGDVGYITEEGAFSYFFNVCRDGNDPVQFREVPDDFQRVHLLETGWKNLEVLRPGEGILCSGAKSRAINGGLGVGDGGTVAAGAGIEFEFERERGAALILPTGAEWSDYEALEHLRQPAMTNAVKWYQHIWNGGFPIPNGSLYLITGYDKTDSWIMLASNKQFTNIGGSLQASVITVGGQCQINMGSQHGSMDHRSLLVPNHSKNQSVFVRGWKMMLNRRHRLLRKGEWEVGLTDIRAAKFEELHKPAKSKVTSPRHRNDQPGRKDDEDRGTGGTGGTGTDPGGPSRGSASEGNGEGGQQDGNSTRSSSAVIGHQHKSTSVDSSSSEQNDTASDSAMESDSSEESLSSSQAYHPSDVINKYLLSKYPDCAIALTHDSTWCSLIQDSDNEIPSDEVLINRVESECQLQQSDDGSCIYFAPSTGMGRFSGILQSSRAPQPQTVSQPQVTPLTYTELETLAPTTTFSKPIPPQSSKTIKMAGLLKRSFLTLAHPSSGLFDMPSPPKRADSQDEQLGTRPSSTASLASSSMITMFPQHTFPPQRLSPPSTHMPSYPNHPQSSPYFNESYHYNDTGEDFSNVSSYGSTYPDPFWPSPDVTTSYTGSSASSASSSIVSEAYNFSQPPSNYSPGWTGSQPNLPSSGQQPSGNLVYRATSYPQLSPSHTYSTTRYHPYANRISPSGSSELVFSPHPAPGLGLSPRVSSPMTPQALMSNVGGEDEKGLGLPLVAAAQSTSNKPLYTHREQLQFFREAISLPGPPLVGPFIPQVMYKPHTNSDLRRYVEEIDLDAPIYFWSENPNECGISLTDALHSRVKGLSNRDETVFEGRGPSVSIRLEWPGYRQWSRQIPTRDFRSPPGPITKAKLAKNIARCVQRFFTDRQGHPLEDDSDARWRIGSGPGLNHIRFEDLILVSIHHVSMGSWQPQLRLSRPFPPAMSLEEF